MNTRPALPLPADPIFSLPPSPTTPIQAEEKIRRTRPSTGLRPRPLVPTSLDQALQLGRAVVAARLAPRGMVTAEACMIAILHGLEVGLSPMQALQRIAVVNGRPTIWGDGALALVQASGLAEEIGERIEGEEPGHWVAICEVLRRGSSLPIIRRFSVDDARRARLWGKSGPWSDYPLRMLQMRARAFALRDAFADVLGGLYLREEIEENWEEAAPPPTPSVSPMGGGAFEIRGEKPVEATVPSGGAVRGPDAPSSAAGETAVRAYPAVPNGSARSVRPSGRVKAPPPPADVLTNPTMPAAPIGADEEMTRVSDTARGGANPPVGASPVSSGNRGDGEAAIDGEPPLRSEKEAPTALPVPAHLPDDVRTDGNRQRDRRSRSGPRTAMSMRYADHWSIRRPRSMPPEPAYRRRPSRARPPMTDTGSPPQTDAALPADVLSAADLLTVYDDALCCAFDTATLEEIVEEFADRIAAQGRDQTTKADVITTRHSRRIAAGELPRSSNGEPDA